MSGRSVFINTNLQQTEVRMLEHKDPTYHLEHELVCPHDWPMVCVLSVVLWR